MHPLKPEGDPDKIRMIIETLPDTERKELLEVFERRFKNEPVKASKFLIILETLPDEGLDLMLQFCIKKRRREMEKEKASSASVTNNSLSNNVYLL